MDELLRRKEESVERYVRENKPAEAIGILFDLIVEYVGRRDFAKAETLRKSIFDIDPLALNEITKSAEMIEEAKQRSIDGDRREIWSSLFSVLTTEEANALYYAFEDRTYKAYQTVFAQGTRNQYLYFINSGNLNLIYNDRGHDVILSTLSSGNIAGSDTFFAISLCTTSLLCVTNAVVSCLNHDYLERWKDELPVLESKLYDFCNRSTCVIELLKQMDFDRRIYKRIPMSGKVEVQLLKASGIPAGGVFKASIADVSMGGLCLLVRINKRETARVLLGRKLRVRFSHEMENILRKTEKMGLVVAVTSHAFDDYSVHVRFDAPLEEDLFADIGNHPGPAVRI